MPTANFKSPGKFVSYVPVLVFALDLAHRIHTSFMYCNALCSLQRISAMRNCVRSGTYAGVLPAP